ncbi:zinc finger protein 106 isoform X1 [Hemiscyllium ocellatum]|uniref:zinc finger protein 106 isoform X1 n=1 Tax=Hemiscyllium ocellatum TaxID=170820 RepID=UPI002966BBF3|nr:zinc finger protein 106 isoform X1 [Hemiscyllium ocellatum]
MGKERKCILCHITYNSKTEMDEHMRSMLHHRELENLKGRDCKHECRICKVTVVGLSAYAKHISSQLHKEKVDAQGREENQRDDGKDEEYFDKELLQLIRQRKEVKRKNDTSTTWNRATENDDRQHRRPREDRQAYPEPMSKYNPSPWHHEKGECNRDWESRDYGKSRSNNFQYCHWKTNSRAPLNWHSSRGSYNWHSNGKGGLPQWYSNYNWHSSGSGGVSGWHSQSQSGAPNWNTNVNNNGDNPSQYMTSCPNARFQPCVLNNMGKLRKLNKKEAKRDRFTWENTQSWRRTADGRGAALAQRDSGNRWNLGDGPFQGYMDFTRDDVTNQGMMMFDPQDGKLSKEDQNGGKGSSPSRDKKHRWAPYRSHKSAELPVAARDPGSKQKGNDDSMKGSMLQKPKELETKHGGSAASVPGKTSGSLSGCENSLNQQAGASENGTKILDKDGNRVPGTLRTNSFPPPEFTPCASNSDPTSLLKENKFSSGTESGKCLSKPGLEAQGCSPFSNAILQPNSPLTASGAPLSTQSSPSLTVQPSLDVPYSAGKYQLDSSLSEELRRAREALRCSQTETVKCSQQEACTESTESNWKNRNNKTACKSPPATASANPSMAEARLGCKEIGEEEFTDISEETKQTMCVDSANICSGQGQLHFNPLKQEMAVLYSQNGDGVSCELSAAKGACKATSAAGSSVHSPTTFSFAMVETKSDNEIQSTAYGKTSDNCSSDSELQNGGPPNSNHLLSELNKLGLPTSIQRDLTRHINAKARPGTHVPEPNLNIARRIRSIGSQRKSESEKESGLKPTLRQLLNVSRRHLNWDQVIQQVAKKKQELGKGLPRFGIEMVPSVQTDLEALELDEDESLSSLEGFQWEGISITPNGTVRKRSLSESSVVTDRRSIYSLFGDEGKDSEGVRASERAPSIPSSQISPAPPGPNSLASQENKVNRNGPAFPSPAQFSSSGVNAVPDTSTSTQDVPFVKTERTSHSPLEFECVSTTNSGPGKKCSNSASDDPCGQNTATTSQRSKVFSQQSSSAAVQGPNAAEGATDSSYTSGGELNDTQTLGKKRRATTDVLSPEVPCLERKNKRRKLKGKRERCQVDQLLSISLREDELNKALQSLDGNLLQARATLQAAYIEVQKLLVLKQQITLEMSTLRSKRIEILQGLQESYDPTGERLPLSPATERSSNNKLHVGLTELNLQTSFSPPLLNNSSPGSSSISQPNNIKTSSALQTSMEKAMPDTSIKQEPVSPKRTEENAKDPWVPSSGFHSALSQLALPGAHNKGEMRSLGFPIITLPPPLQQLGEGLSLLGPGGPGIPVDCSRSGIEEARGTVLPAFKLQKGGETGEAQQRKAFAMPDQSNPPPAGKCQKDPKFPEKDRRSRASEQVVESSFTASEGKGVKKKKKLRKKKSARVEQAGENSDTEQDTEIFRPTRKLKNKRTPKGKVTTSTPQESEGISVPREKGGPKGESEMASASTDSDFSVELVEIPKPQVDVIDVESVELATEQPDSPSKGEQPIPSQCPTDTPKAGCNEVTSTSEMVTGLTKSVAETQTPGSSLKGSRNTSEVSSDGAEDENPTEGTFEGHRASVNAMQIYNGHLYTCSADKTVRIYNLMSRKCVGLFEGHSTKVNCLLIVHIQGKIACLYTGSSDHTVRCYDVKSKKQLDQFTLSDRVLSLHSRWRILYIGLANGSVYSFSVKANKQLDVFDCHGPRAISCLATAQEGARRLLLVGSYDCTISVRDARNGLLLRTLKGHTKTVLCMKVVNDLVFSGSSDQSVHAHNIHTGELVRIYKGHNHAVTVVNILGKVMVTACLDKLVRVYELQSHDRLQVYGGHKDMLMCMVIHKSMIYTGCYDGSIQAVRLNLMQNFRCWWSGCTLIFGVLSHLKHHLLSDHHNPTFQTQKCRWRNCDAFFSVKNGSTQDVPKHLCEHAEENGQVDP